MQRMSRSIKAASHKLGLTQRETQAMLVALEISQEDGRIEHFRGELKNRGFSGTYVRILQKRKVIRKTRERDVWTLSPDVRNILQRDPSDKRGVIAAASPSSETSDSRHLTEQLIASLEKEMERSEVAIAKAVQERDRKQQMIDVLRKNL